MQPPKKPFEHIYIYLTGFNTTQDGMIMAIFTMDGYSEFAFNPVIEKQLNTDQALKQTIRKVFNNILKEYRQGKHPETVTFITNLPPETEEFISDIISIKHKLVFDEKLTKKAVEPLVKRIMGN